MKDLVFSTPSIPGDRELEFDTRPDFGRVCTVKWDVEATRSGLSGMLSFGTADMDFRSPPQVIDRLIEVAAQGHYGYPARPDSYFEALQGYLARNFEWNVERSWIESGVGIYPSMHPIISELTAPGDEILYQPPVHHVFEAIIRANDRVPLPSPLLNNDGRYEMDIRGLKAAITGKTKLLLLCNPHNPNGRVWTKAELAELAEVCQERNIFVLADEVYSGLLYPGQRFTPFATVSAWAAMNTFTLTSASKSFNLTGLKHSAVITANPELRAAYNRGLARTALDYGGSTFGIAALESAVSDCDDWSVALMEYVRANHAFLVSAFAESLPDVRITVPEATYFAWMDLRPLGLARVDYESAIHDIARLVVVYGEVMGPGGEGHIRINLGTSRSTLEEGVTRLLDALKQKMAQKKKDI